MSSDFRPLFRHAHLATIAGNFWPRQIDGERFPATRRVYKVDPKNSIVAFEHQPEVHPQGQIVFLHGLEGSADAGYVVSFSQEALLRGFGVHRLNLRTCGGTEDLCETMYHSGLTSDTHTILERLLERFGSPLFLVGFSLGGNVALKLAGELGSTALLTGVCAVSTPIDLATCVQTIDKPANTLYARRFLSRLTGRIRRKCSLASELYSERGLDQIRTIWEFDDRFTAPLFGFGTASNYYATQSAVNFLDTIRVPTLVISAKDDPLVPITIYDHPAFNRNPALRLLITEHGGHLGFLSRNKPRFWIDGVALDWIETILPSPANQGTTATQVTSV